MGQAINLVLGCWIMLVVYARVTEGQLRQPDIRLKHSTLHFQHMGEMVGMGSHGSISFRIDIAEFVLHLANSCRVTATLSRTSRASFSYVGEMSGMQESLEARCYAEARTLTQILTSWISEEDLHNHDLLQLDEELYNSEHKAASAPLDIGEKTRRSFRPGQEPERNEPDYYSELEMEDLDLTTPSLVTDATSMHQEVNNEKKRGFRFERTELEKVRRVRRFVLAGIIGALGGLAMGGTFSGLFHSSASEEELRHVTEDIGHVLSLEEAQISRHN